MAIPLPPHPLLGPMAISCLAATLLLASVLPAHPTPSLEPGAQLRITGPALPNTPIVGTLQQISADSLTLQPRSQFGPLTFPLASITTIERDRGRKPSTMLLGAGIGAGLGLLAGSLLGTSFFYCDDPQNDDWCSSNRHEAVLSGTLLVGLPSALVGFFSGLALTNLIVPARWEPVPLPVVLGFSPRGVYGAFLFPIHR